MSWVQRWSPIGQRVSADASVTGTHRRSVWEVTSREAGFDGTGKL